MTQVSFVFHAASEADTERLGQWLAEQLPTGCTVALDGPLGAGKTRLVQAIAVASGVDRADVVSPTFVLVHEYQGRRKIYHIDAYRLNNEEEFFEVGAHEYFQLPHLVLIEWSERIASWLPAERLEISIAVNPDETRDFTLTGLGSQAAAIVERLQQNTTKNSLPPSTPSH